MTRIAGIVLKQGATEGEAARSVTSMLKAVSQALPRVGERGGAAVGVAGATAGGAAFSGPLVVLDGCIYNRDELGEEGTDAEAVAALFARHGIEETLRRLNGDFALAVVDGETAWLARDRIGIKPLYYAAQGRMLAFASRLRSLTALPAISRAPRASFVARFAGSHYRTFDNDPHASPYEAVAQLPGGWLLRFEGGETHLRQWWTLRDEGDADEPEEVLAEQYRALLLDAVRRRLACTPGAVFTLSGGMDSSSVLACAVQATGARQPAISTVYEDATYDESDEIRSMLDSAVDGWHAVRIGSPDLEALVPRMIALNDEPVATATWLSHYLLCEAARADGRRGLFGGLGGDELNAGEYEHFFSFFADLATQGDERRLLAETARWVDHHDHPIHRKSEAVMRSALDRMFDMRSPGVCRPDMVRLLRYRDALGPEYRAQLDAFVPEMDVIYPSYLKNRAFHDIFRETAPCCLRAADRHTEAFDLEMRWPFFDHRVVEMMFRVPSTMKIRDGVTKHLLREAMRGVLAEETRTRVKKTGWNAPAHVWFSGKGRDLVEDIIASRRFAERGIYDVARVRRLLEEHEEIVATGRMVDNHMMFFWQLVNLELWLRQDEAL